MHQPRLSQPPSKPYSVNTLYCFVGAYILFWFLVLEGLGQRSLLQFAVCLCLGLIVSIVLLDLRGFFTLQGLIVLRGTRLLLILLCLCTLPLWTAIYLIRTSQAYKRLPLMNAPVRQGAALALVAGIAGTLILYVAAANVSASPSAATRLTATPTTALQQLAQVDTATPTIQPTATPVPQQRVTQSPTTQATQSLTPQPTRTSTPERTGYNGNPWGYDFNTGNYIYNPPPEFCTSGYFLCVPDFNNGTGYVVQCQDGRFSRSGGKPGTCSQHGGYKQTLYAH